MGLPELEVVLGGATSSDLLLFTANWNFLVHFGRGHELRFAAIYSKLELFGTQHREPREPPEATGDPEVVARRAARTPLPHAPEVRMTVVKQTPSNNIDAQLLYRNTTTLLAPN